MADHRDELRFFVAAETVRREILDFLSDGKAYYPRQIAASLRLLSYTVRNELNALRKAGSVTRNGPEPYYQYQLGTQCN